MDTRQKSWGWAWSSHSGWPVVIIAFAIVGVLVNRIA